MRFLVDMNLSPDVATWLRQQGHDAVHVVDIGYGRALDQDIFVRAAAEQRIVISLDLDFGDIAAYAATLRTGIVLLRLRRAGQAIVIERLRVAIAEGSDAMEQGAVVLVEDSRIRIRHAP